MGAEAHHGCTCQRSSARGRWRRPELVGIPGSVAWVTGGIVLKIINAQSSRHLGQVRKLFQEYAAALGFDLCFQDFDRELAELPGEYAPPAGGLLLALDGEKVAGCIALRPIDEHACEMKRLYIRPDSRHLGVGRALATAVIEEARKIGYDVMRLDTVPSMTAAITLYESLGFVDIEAYRHNPIQGARFMELVL